MSKKMTKILASFLTVIMMISMLMIPVFASNDYLDPEKITPNDNANIADTASNDYLDPEKITPNDNANIADTAYNITGQILSIVQIIGVAVAVIMLIVVAIKYISAAPSDKAEIKKHIVVYVVGAVILFAATGILEIIKNFAGIIEYGNG